MQRGGGEDAPKARFSSFTKGTMTRAERDEKGTPELSRMCLVRRRGTLEAEAQTVRSP